MKKLINHINSKYYFRFLIYMLIALGLVLGLYAIDLSIQNTPYTETLNFSQNFLEDFLIMMIAAIITMVTITFSTIMVVLTLYSGQFSPRTLNDFLQRKVPLNILGYFIGIIIYALIGLIISENHATIIFANTTFMALILFVVSVILFAYYIHYVAKSVQVNVYIDKMVKEAVSQIEDVQQTIQDDPLVKLERNDEDEEKDFEYEYKAKRTGYLIDINKKKLISYLKENNLSISVKIPLNEHIYEDDVLFNYQGQKSVDFDEEIIKDAFIINDEIGSFSAYREKTMKLVEIGVRALSPGTNDPFTAISCIEQLGFVFKKLSDTYYSLYYHDDSGKERLMIRTLNYDDLLYDHFYQIYLYGKDNLSIISNMLEAFTRIAGDSNHDMLVSLWQFAKYIIKDIDLPALHPLDFKEIQVPLKELAIQCHKKDDYQALISKD